MADATGQRPVPTGAKVVLALVTGLIDAAGIAAALIYSFFVTAFIGVCTDSPDACDGIEVFYVLMAVGVGLTIWLWIRHLRQTTLGRRAAYAVGSTLPTLALAVTFSSVG